MIMNKMKRLITTIVALLFLSELSLMAEEGNGNSKIGVGVGVGISVPHGLRVEGGVRFNSYLSTRVGIGFLPQLKLYDGATNQLDLSAYKEQLGYDPEAHIKARLGCFAGHLLLDCHPFQNGFRVTVGTFIGHPSAVGNVALVNPQNGQSIMDDPRQNYIDPNHMPKFKIKGSNEPEELIIQPSPQATVDVTLNLGRTFQPYFGIGYGYAVPKTRVSFILDVGALFNGKATISSPNVIQGNPNMIFSIAGDQVIKARYYTQILPVLNLGVSIRLY